MPIDSTALLGISMSAPFSFRPSYSMFIARRCSAVGLFWYDLAASSNEWAISISAWPRMMRACFSRSACACARHRVLQRARDDDVPHLDRRDGHAPGVRALIDELLQLGLDVLAAAQEVGERRASDDVAQRRLRRPAHGLGVVLHLERGLLDVVHHPEQHRVDVDRNGVGRQRLLGGEARRDRPLIDPRDDAIDERARSRRARARAARRSGRA